MADQKIRPLTGNAGYNMLMEFDRVTAGFYQADGRAVAWDLSDLCAECGHTQHAVAMFNRNGSMMDDKQSWEQVPGTLTLLGHFISDGMEQVTVRLDPDMDVEALTRLIRGAVHKMISSNSKPEPIVIDWEIS